ncbi:hypothetical protein [uncultured Tateyamaria sp.]|uniref:hypothetical protein n=1 Tax=uncultured Tateyamaria sp. TaxID=455651 RepID=UPI002629CD45|nr:hypothetical protein [uncultured Tateyamaria sp.]
MNAISEPSNDMGASDEYTMFSTLFSALPEPFVDVGTSGDDTMFSTLSSTLKAKAGDDTIITGGGNGRILAGPGDDRLEITDGGVTKSSGGAGSDVFVFDDKGGTHLVTDFSLEEMDAILLIGDSSFEWERTDTFEVTAYYGDTTLIFENVTGREFTYEEAFL